MSNKKQFVKLDELVSGKLPNRILNAVSRMDMSVDEIMDWEHSKPTFHVTMSDGYLRINIRKQYSLKKVIAIVSSILGITWALIQFVAPYLA